MIMMNSLMTNWNNLVKLLLVKLFIVHLECDKILNVGYLICMNRVE
jgi:hypothetical protein